MANVNIPYSEAGMASFELGDTYGSIEIFSGSSPLPVTEDFPVASGVAIPAFSVVGLTAGNVVMAEQDGDPLAIGITTAAVQNTGSAQRVAIYRAGCFNPAALNWHASFTTDAQKAAAFRGAPTPTDILIRPFL